MIQKARYKKVKFSKSSFMGRIRGYFLTGLLVLSPIVLTIFIFYWLFTRIDGLLRQYVSELLFKAIGVDFINRSIPGIGVLSILILIILTGAIARNYFGNRILSLGSQIVSRIPIINRIYITLQQISEAFFSERSEVFKRAVLIEYPRKGIYSIGFITQDTRGVVQTSLKKDVVSVFLPTTPNPTSGYLLFVPKTDVIELSTTVEEALKLVISGGSIIPKEIPIRPALRDGEVEPKITEPTSDNDDRSMNLTT